MQKKPEDLIAGKKRPFTGKEYLESLHDDRQVYINGERVKDVTTHTSFRNSVRTLARLYDALHDPKTKDVLTSPTDTGSGGYTHKYFRVARSREELVAQQAAITEWSRMTYGWMGRTPDYKASLMNTLGANADYYGKFSANAKAWYKRAQENVLFMNHAIVNPPVDRGRPTNEIKDVYVTIQKETDAGVIVSGAKVVATSAAFTHYNFLGQNAATATSDPDLAIMFILPMDAPGVKLFCRTSYEQIATALGTPFDYPLSSRFDENDAIFVLDNVLIPWENVLVHRDTDKILSFYPRSGFLNGFCFQGCTRFAVKLDFMAGLLNKALYATGGDEFRGNQAMLGEVIAWRNLFWSLSDCMVNNPQKWVGDALLPNLQAALSYRVFAPRRLSAHQGDHREDRGLGADLPAVLGARLQESGDRSVPEALRARLARRRIQGAHQDHEAPVGRHRHRVRRPPRALRAQLRRQPRGHPHPDADRRQAQRLARRDDGAGRQVHGRLRRERLDRRHLDRFRRGEGGQGQDPRGGVRYRLTLSSTPANARLLRMRAMEAKHGHDR